MNIGSHLSVAGGPHKALEQAAKYNFNSVAIFVRNQVQWKVPPLKEDTITRFRKTREELHIKYVVAHASYLINLAGKDDVRAKSIQGMVTDIQRCNNLGVEFLVLHPGSNPDTSKGIEMIADGLNTIINKTADCSTIVLLETTAGQGNCIGHRFEHLAGILEKTENPDRFGICLDTCHIFAAGYDLRTEKTYNETMKSFDNIIGFKKLYAIHLNDSKKELGTRVDRHEHLGRGFLGKDSFFHLANDKRLRHIPFIMETPKHIAPNGEDWDEINAKFFLNLVKNNNNTLKSKAK